jgi:hypothetical protein
VRQLWVIVESRVANSSCLNDLGKTRHFHPSSGAPDANYRNPSPGPLPPTTENALLAQTTPAAASSFVR